jgi:hypothetical protein
MIDSLKPDASVAWGTTLSALRARISDAFCRVPDMGLSPKAADLSIRAKRKSGKLPGVAGRIVAKRGIVRPVDHADPRSLDHPGHKEKWLELARVLGRMDAKEDFERLHRKGKPDVEPKVKAHKQRRPRA